MLFEKKKKLTLRISGMRCEHCVAKVEKTLRKLGCKADVELASGKAEVSAPASLNETEIVAAVEKAGFSAEIA